MPAQGCIDGSFKKLSATKVRHRVFNCLYNQWWRRFIPSQIFTIWNIKCFCESPHEWPTSSLKYNLTKSASHYKSVCVLCHRQDTHYGCVQLALFLNKNAKVNTSKNHVYEKYDVIRMQSRFAAPFPNKTLLRNRHSKEKSRGYFVYSYSRIVSIERALKIH